MKKIKIFLFIFIFLVIFVLASCGSGTKNGGTAATPAYSKIHVEVGDYSGCFTAVEYETRYHYSTGIHVTTKEFGKMYLPQGTYFLFADNCPFCREVQK